MTLSDALEEIGLKEAKKIKEGDLFISAGNRTYEAVVIDGEYQLKVT